MRATDSRITALCAASAGVALVAKCREMLYRLANAVQIVNANVADMRACHSDVGEDQRHITQLQVFEQEIFHAEGHDGNAIHAAFNHAPHRGLDTFGIVPGRGQKNFVLVLNGNTLENLHDFREKGIGDFGNDKAKNAAPPRNQCSSLSIRIITKLLDYLPNALGKLGIDGGDMIDGPRDSCGGYLGTPGDFTDIHNLCWVSLVERKIEEKPNRFGKRYP
jgi:hypothetical protein